MNATNLRKQRSDERVSECLNERLVFAISHRAIVVPLFQIPPKVQPPAIDLLRNRSLFWRRRQIRLTVNARHSGLRLGEAIAVTSFFICTNESCKDDDVKDIRYYVVSLQFGSEDCEARR
jgi:hypothetical protein